jgi:hypothetical protein
MKQMAAIAAAAMIAWQTVPAAAQPAGEYTVRGTNPDRSEYVAQARVERAGDRFQVTWVFAGSSAETRGLGLFINNVFSVAYSGVGGGAGLAMYILRPDGTWDGRWIMPDQQRWGEEIWTRRAR